MARSYGILEERMAAQPAAPVLAPSRPVVLDGGLATELERRGHDLSGRSRSVRAGAQVETTASSKRVRRWLDLGARFVGGCCGIGPEQIRSLARVATGSG